jgi:hypothetical protein
MFTVHVEDVHETADPSKDGTHPDSANRRLLGRIDWRIDEKNRRSATVRPAAPDLPEFGAEQVSGLSRPVGSA